MHVIYDASVWKPAQEHSDGALMQPVGKAESDLDPVRIERVAGAQGDKACEQAAGFTLSSMYGEPVGRRIRIAGRDGWRFEAEPRCRNAMPEGIATCVAFEGSVYVISATRPGCRSGTANPFSATDPIRDLVLELRFGD